MGIQITDNIRIGDNHPVFIIAEVGNNHQGKFELAKKAIDFAHEAKADAVTFQYAPIGTYCIKSMYSDHRVAFLKECEFSLNQISRLRDYAKKLSLAFSVNVEDRDTLDEMLNIGVDFIKLCSADLTNIPYIKYCASKKKVIFFSTGAAYLGEIETAYNAMKDGGLEEYIIYHTNSGYPTAVKDANIRQMDLLHIVFGGIKGYCDHTVDIIPPVVAVARGAKVIEKHITTDRSLKGDDWMVSLEPDEFKLMVKYIRQAEASLGSVLKQPMACETSTRTFKRKSIVSKTRIVKGSVLNENHLCYKIPGTGLSPLELNRVVGKKTKVDIPEDTLILPEMIEGWE
ncbi:N-acetylneuraminate synthase family protein [bacterium]|nr:N-acetylneuraminate synthase family protein [bacterium]